VTGSIVEPMVTGCTPASCVMMAGLTVTMGLVAFIMPPEPLQLSE
jgi:hypothetical protein